MICSAVKALGLLAVLLLEAPAKPPPPVTFTAEVVGDKPLPYQAVRLRLTAENTGQNRTGTLFPMEGQYALAVIAVKRPGERDFAKREIPVIGGGYSPIISKPGQNRDRAFDLSTGERITLTVAVGVSVKTQRWDPQRPGTAEPLFVEQGTYVLRVRYWCVFIPKSGQEDSVYAEVKVEVGKPGEKDKPWFEALDRDPDLARWLLHPEAVCTAEQAAEFRRLIEKAPDSSYADYGRLALAHHQFRTAGKKATKQEREAEWAKALDTLDKMAERKESAGFAFLPHARLHLRTLDRELKGYLEFVMNRDFPDALEWLVYLNDRLDREEWDKLRKPAPAKSAPKK